jgi:hypothetical protein
MADRINENKKAKELSVLYSERMRRGVKKEDDVSKKVNLQRPFFWFLRRRSFVRSFFTLLLFMSMCASLRACKFTYVYVYRCCKDEKGFSFKLGNSIGEQEDTSIQLKRHVRIVSNALSFHLSISSFVYFIRLIILEKLGLYRAVHYYVIAARKL